MGKINSAAPLVVSLKAELGWTYLTLAVGYHRTVMVWKILNTHASDRTLRLFPGHLGTRFNEQKWSHLHRALTGNTSPKEQASLVGMLATLMLSRTNSSIVQEKIQRWKTPTEVFSEQLLLGNNNSVATTS